MHPSVVALPASMDRILTVLEKATRDWKVTSIDTFDMDIIIARASESLRVVDTKGEQIGFDRYRFFSWGQEDKVLRVHLELDGGVSICVKDHWLAVPVAVERLSWSLPTEADAESGDKDRRIARQRQWWVENRKKFHFLRLPAEIRNIVYRTVFGSRVVPYYANHRFKRYRQRTRFQLDRSISILRVSRLINQEARHVLYHDTPFTIEHLAVARRLLATRFPSNNLRRLQFKLAHEDWFTLFGAKPTEDGDIREPASSAWALRAIQLHRLELYMPNPSTSSRESRRWLDSGGACQEIAVNWIFEAVWQVVRDLAITITGFVKPKQKVAFEAACEIERHKFLIWREMRKTAGAVELLSLHDWDEDVKQIQEPENGDLAKDVQHVEAAQGMEKSQDTDDTKDSENLSSHLVYMKAKGQADEEDESVKLKERLASRRVYAWKPGSAVISRETPVCVHGLPCSRRYWLDTP